MNEETQKQSHPERDNPDWERDLLQKLAFASFREQRRARRWGIFFKFSLLAYFVLLLVFYLPVEVDSSASGEEHTALVKIEGLITEGGDVNAEQVIGSLQDAFEDQNTKGVILQINSPGGTPVQAGYINDEMVRLREKYPKIPLYAVISDICASGGYYVAAAADQIYADKSSVVGSIGVLINGFGFVEAMENLGVERRLLTAGEHKGLFDPFSPQNPQEVAHLRSVLDDLYQQFIAVVKRGRGDRLQGAEEELFSGLVWSGRQAIRLGLVDGLGSVEYVAREVIGAEEVVDFTGERDYLERFAERLGASMGKVLTRQLGLGLTVPGATE